MVGKELGNLAASQLGIAPLCSGLGLFPAPCEK